MSRPSVRPSVPPPPELHQPASVLPGLGCDRDPQAERGGHNDTGKKPKHTKDLPGGVLRLQRVNFLVPWDSKLWLNRSVLMSTSKVDNGRKLLLIGQFSSC